MGQTCHATPTASFESCNAFCESLNVDGCCESTGGLCCMFENVPDDIVNCHRVGAASVGAASVTPSSTHLKEFGAFIVALVFNAEESGAVVIGCVLCGIPALILRCIQENQVPLLRSPGGSQLWAIDRSPPRVLFLSLIHI